MTNANSKLVTVGIEIVDCSGSMGDRLSLAKRIGKELLPSAFGYDQVAFYLLESSKHEIISIRNLSASDKSRIENFMDDEFAGKIGGGTRFWEPSHDIVKEIKSMVQQQNPDAYVEVHLTMLTDGEDNGSSGNFHGTEGAHHLVEMLEDDSNIHVTLSLLALGDAWSDKDKGRLFLSSAKTGGTFLSISDNATPDVVTKETRNFVQTIQEPLREAKKEATPQKQIAKLKQLTNGRKFNLQMTTDSTPSIISNILGEWNKMKNPSHHRYVIYEYFVGAKNGNSKLAENAFLQSELGRINLTGNPNGCI